MHCWFKLVVCLCFFKVAGGGAHPPPAHHTQLACAFTHVWSGWLSSTACDVLLEHGLVQGLSGFTQQGSGGVRFCWSTGAGQGVESFLVLLLLGVVAAHGRVV